MASRVYLACTERRAIQVPLVVAPETASGVRRAFRESWAKEENAEPVVRQDTQESRASRESRDRSTHNSRASQGSQVMTVWPADVVLPGPRARSVASEIWVAQDWTGFRVLKVGLDLPEEWEFPALPDSMDLRDSGAIPAMEPGQWASILQGIVNKRQCQCALKEQQRCGMDIR